VYGRDAVAVEEKQVALFPATMGGVRRQLTKKLS